MRSYNVNTVNLKILRTKYNKTQKDMSIILNISITQYLKKENGKADFTLKQAKIIADTFYKSIDEIFFGDKILI